MSINVTASNQVKPSPSEVKSAPELAPLNQQSSVAAIPQPNSTVTSKVAAALTGTRVSKIAPEMIATLGQFHTEPAIQSPAPQNYRSVSTRAIASEPDAFKSHQEEIDALMGTYDFKI